MPLLGKMSFVINSNKSVFQPTSEIGFLVLIRYKQFINTFFLAEEKLAKVTKGQFDIR